MTSNIDNTVLRMARRSVSVWLPEPFREGGIVTRSGVISEAAQHEAAERLLERGLVAYQSDPPDPSREPREQLVRYSITDSGRAHLREAEGLGPLTVNQARTMHALELRDVWGDDPMAQRQLSLRDTVGARVRGVLTALGHRYSGTGGWHIIPHVTPDGAVGFVDSARGVAVETDVVLDAESVEALTIPGQAEGPQASGAAAWTSPDPGGARQASAPSGWTQLLVDLRDHLPIDDDVECSARVVAWGLRTCYQHLGRPGHRGLDDRLLPEADHAREWSRHVSQETREAVEAVGWEWLADVCLELAEEAGCHDDVSRHLAARDVAGAIRASGAYALSPSYGYSPEGAVRLTVGTGYPPGLLEHLGIKRIAILCGDSHGVGGMRLFDLARYLLERILTRDLLPHSETLCRQLVPRDLHDEPSETRHTSPWCRVTVHEVPPVLREIGRTLVSRRLAHRASEAHRVEEAMWGTLYLCHGGPIAPGRAVS